MLLNITKRDIPLLLQTIGVATVSLNSAIEQASKEAPGGAENQARINQFNELKGRLAAIAKKLEHGS